MNSKAEEIIKHKGRPSETVEIDEKDAYNELLKLVQSLISKADETKPEHSDDVNKPKNWRVAKEIYNWVIDNIKYDRESTQKDENGEKSFRKPQNALFVYSQRKGVCLGKANLVNLMMRMAKIPCVVIGTSTHAYNAIYLSSDDPNRSGWTFIDATWGAPTSDLGYVEEAGDLIEGEANFLGIWVQTKFNRDNEYTKAIQELTSIPENMEINDKSVNALNAKIAEKLPDLNEKLANDFKFTDIKVNMVKGEYGDYFQCKYKTDLSYDKAESIIEELEDVAKNRQIEDYINCICCFDDNGKLAAYFDEWYLPKNEQKSKSEEYINKLNDIFVNILKNYKRNEIEKDIEKINENINTEIEQLNTNFKDIVTIKSVEFKMVHDAGEEYDEVGVPVVYLKSSLTFDDAKKTVEKKLNNKNIEKRKEYFPAFYNDQLSFTDINKDMIQKPSHKMTSIYIGTIHASDNNYLENRWDLTINGATYSWHIDEKGESYIEVDTKDENKNNVVEISPDIANLGIPLKIGYRTKSLKLIGDQTVDISNAIGLKDVDVSASNKYEGFNRDNRKLINNGGEFVQPQEVNSISDSLLYAFLTKQDQFLKAVDGFEKFKESKEILIVENYNYEIVDKCFDIFNEVSASKYSPEKVKEAETLMDKAIEQINQFKQKLNSNNQSNK